MAGKTKSMSIIKQLLLQLHQGQSKKQIVRDMGISKKYSASLFTLITRL